MFLFIVHAIAYISVVVFVVAMLEDEFQRDRHSWIRLRAFAVLWPLFLPFILGMAIAEWAHNRLRRAVNAEWSL